MYTVLRFEKFKGDALNNVAKELRRKAEDYYKYGAHYDNSDIDWSRTSSNVFLDDCVGGVKKYINKQIAAAGARVRPDSVLAVGAVITASDEYFTRAEDGSWLYDDKAAKFFEDGRQFLIDNMCGGDASRLVSCVVHMDEKTPHLQALLVPLTENERGEMVLSAKRLMNGRQRMRELQDRFYEAVGKPRGFERGEKVDLTKPATKKHKKPADFKQENRATAIETIDKAAEVLERKNLEIGKVKDAAFGRGKVLDMDTYNKVVDIINASDALLDASAGLKKLLEQVDIDGRVRTAENDKQAALAFSSELEKRLEVGHRKAREWGNELELLRAESAAFGELLQSIHITPDRTFADIWEQSKKQATDGYGVVDFSRVAYNFQSIYLDIKSGRAAQREKELELELEKRNNTVHYFIR